jgi:peptidoglycan/LPS O-acetylase OafA/YrhL
METAVPRDRRTEFNVTLNGYRGLCALLVFAFHLGSAGVVDWPGGTPAKDLAYDFWTSLSFGVDMFFMISGFVILGSLSRHDDVGDFLRDRVVRIFSAWIPALLAVSAICIALRMKVFADVTFLQGLWIFVANFFLLPPLAPVPMIHIGSWSLTYEWVFYFTAAAGVLAYRRAPGSVWATVAWAVPAMLFVTLYPRAIYFMTGVLVFKYRDWFATKAQWLKWPLASLCIFLLAWRAIGMDEHTNNTLPELILDGRWILGLLAFVASVHMFACVCLNSSRQTGFLNSAVFQFLGNISYSFYLWHVLVMSLTKRIVIGEISPVFGTTFGFIVFLLSSLAIAIPVSWASWQVFEVLVARKWRHALKRRPVVAAAPVVVP